MLLAGRCLLLVTGDDELRLALTAAAAEGGAELVACPGGREALARVDAGGVDAAVVDLPLADLRGDVFLVSLRDRGVPCVAVSGVLRGERYAALALQFGVLTYLEKPFRPEAALGRLAQALPGALDPDTEPAFAEVAAPTPPPRPALTPTPPPRAAPQPFPLPAPAPAPVPLPPASPPPAPAPPQEATPAPASPPAASPSPSPAPPPSPGASLPPPPPPAASTPPAPAPPREAAPAPTAPPAAAPALDPLLDESLDPDSVIYSPARPALDDTLPGIPLRRAPAQGLDLPLPSTTPLPFALPADAPALPEGSLARTSLPRLLVALHRAHATGALAFSRGEARKVVLLDGGQVVLAASNVRSERFGARCVAAGLLGREEEAELAAALGPTSPLGEALVARGRLDPATRARLIGEQVRDIVWSAFAWDDGAYRFAAGRLPRRPRVPVDVPFGDLVLEGHRRATPLEALRAGLPDGLALAPRTDGVCEPYQLALSGAEASLLAHADGTKTVRDLVLLSHLPERAALAFLQGCRDLGLLDEARRVLSGTRRMGFM